MPCYDFERLQREGEALREEARQRTVELRANHPGCTCYAESGGVFRGVFTYIEHSCPWHAMKKEGKS